jgi:cytochrome c oxidase subunit 3
MSDARATHPDPHAGGQPRFLAHHFGSYGQQFDAGKLGMWIFLLTEILLFGGLFAAYAVYRANHPEIFIYGHRFLDKDLGALNTCVLIFSSLTMAWGVRCAQRGRRRGLITCLLLTLLCACTFLGVKYVEYRHKWREGLLWAAKYDPKEKAEHAAGVPPKRSPPARPERRAAVPPAPLKLERPAVTAVPPALLKPDRPALPADQTVAGQPIVPEHVGIFFSFYFAMTGLHAIHVLAGMAAIGWVLRRAVRGDFNCRYFGPVDYVGLYWHLVDMVWIYLFPLLYLIR